MAAIKYWIWLSQVLGVSNVSAYRLLEYFGTPEAVYFARELDYELVHGIGHREIERLKDKSMDAADEILGDCDRLDIGVMAMTDTGYPERLRNIFNPPLVLYTKGRMPVFDDEAAVGVVGTRDSTPYGVLCAEKIAYEIAKGGGVVVTGLAKGIDSAAARGAIRAGSSPAGILGTGVDIVFPPGNGPLQADVAASGVLISEYSPGTVGNRSNFPARNRIISGLSLGVVIVEAPRRSGSLITAGAALEQGRDVFAVPGNIDLSSFEGSNGLIKDGAKLITSGFDVLIEYRELFPNKIGGFPRGRYKSLDKEQSAMLIKATAKNPGRVANTTKKEIDTEDNKEYIDLKDRLEGLSEESLSIITVIAEKRTVHVDDIIEITQLPASRVLSSLTILEIGGYVRQLAGKRFELNLEETEERI